MSVELSKEAQAKVVSTTVELLIFKGIPAAAKLLSELSKKDEITVEEIRALKGELDSRSYFE